MMIKSIQCPNFFPSLSFFHPPDALFPYCLIKDCIGNFTLMNKALNVFPIPLLYSEEHITMEGDVMWVGSSSRRSGYLLFNCATLEDPPKETTAQKYTMTFKFSQVGLPLLRRLLVFFYVRSHVLHCSLRSPTE